MRGYDRPWPSQRTLLLLLRVLVCPFLFPHALFARVLHFTNSALSFLLLLNRSTFRYSVRRTFWHTFWYSKWWVNEEWKKKLCKNAMWGYDRPWPSQGLLRCCCFVFWFALSYFLMHYLHASYTLLTPLFRFYFCSIDQPSDTPSDVPSDTPSDIPSGE